MTGLGAGDDQNEDSNEDYKGKVLNETQNSDLHFGERKDSEEDLNKDNDTSTTMEELPPQMFICFLFPMLMFFCPDRNSWCNNKN